MSVMERRLQILLDEERYRRVQAAAEQQGRSVAAVIREAIDVAVPVVDLQRTEALSLLLSMTQDPRDEPVPDWTETKRLMDEELERKLAR